MIIRPDFYRPLPVDRDAERSKLGLDPVIPTGVVMFGGQGSMAMLHIATELDDVQLILMCGHHQALATRLRGLKSSPARAVVGFTPEVRRFLQLGDFFIGKPGPGSLSEAVQQGLPVITVRNAWTLPQERYNTDWIREHGLGVVGASIRNLRPAVNELVGRLHELVANVHHMDNRAVFEVPDILAAILEAGERRGGSGCSDSFPGLVSGTLQG
jgi:UDP-N-acetylglucosamine:LPS N-acetylglucosamine transferase